MAEVYVATRTLGVYYSDDFTPTGATMPTWTAVNTGLPNTVVRQAMMDPFDNTMYVLLDDPRDIYKLVDGTWELLISNAQVRTLRGVADGLIYAMTFDVAIPGMIYLTHQGGTGGSSLRVVRSSDYGENWVQRGQIGAYVQYIPGFIQAKNNYVYLTTNLGLGNNQEVMLSQDGFATAELTNGGSDACPAWFDWHDPTYGYVADHVGSTKDLKKVEYSPGLTITILQVGINIGSPSGDNGIAAMWQSRLTSGHKRGFGGGKLFVSYDNWGTLQNANPDNIGGGQLAYYYDDEDVVIFGADTPGAGVHIIQALADETSTTPVNRAGGQVTTPYTESIPDNNGGLAYEGIHFVRAEVHANINVHATNLNANETGYEPMWGDRSAWDDIGYPERHARGWPAGASHHAAITLADGSPGTLDGQELDLTGIVEHPIAFEASSILTLSGGTVTASGDYHIIAAESGTTDDLDTINGGADRQVLAIQADTGDTITVKHGTGNINLNVAADFELSGDKSLLLFYDGTNWSDLGAGGGGGGAGDMTKAVYDTDDDGKIDIAAGGTGEATAQAAINALTSVLAATNEHVLTKDTATGNAVFKAASGGGGATDILQVQVFS